MPSSGNGAAKVVPQVAERSGGNPLFAEEMVNRLLEEETVEADALPSTVQSLLAARLDSLERLERRLLQSASVVGQTFWEGSLATTAAEEGLDLGRTLATLEEKDLLVPSQGSRLAGEREYAFKHVLIRDVAYSMLPKSVRCRKHVEVAEFIRERAGERTDGVIGLIAEHFARAAALGSEAGSSPTSSSSSRAQALESLEAAGDAAAALYSNAEAFDRYTAALELSDSLDPDVVARIGEKQGDVALRMGRVDAAVAVWERCLAYHRAEEDLARVADLHRKIGAALWHKGERRASIDNYQRGIDLLKDGPPCIELVRLYEEAASLYMHTGRQHARHLRLREGAAPRRAARRGPGGEPRARHLRAGLRPDRRLREGPREPGALGGARPRVRPLARPSGRCSPSATTSRSPRPTTRAPPTPTARRWRSRRRSATCPRRWSCTPRSASWRSTPPTGRRSSGRPRRAPSSPSARACTASSASPT